MSVSNLTKNLLSVIKKISTSLIDNNITSSPAELELETALDVAMTKYVQQSGGAVTTNYYTQTADFTLSDFTSAQKVDGTELIDVVDGDGSHSITINGNNVTGITPDNTKRNVITRYWLANVVSYWIELRDKPDLVAPTFVSAATGSTTTIVVSFNKTLGGTPNFAVVGNTITNQVKSGSTVIITVGTVMNENTVLSVSGGNTLTNASGEATYAGLPSTSVTNNISSFTSLKSLAVASGNEIVTGAGTSALRFCDGTTNGNFTVSFDLKYASTGGYQRIMIFGGLEIRLNANNLEAIIYSAGAATYYFSALAGLPQNTWNRIAIVYAGSGCGIVLNGTNQGSLDHTGSTGAANLIMMDFTTTPGVTFGGGGGGGLPLTSGKLDNILLINKAISGSELTENTGGTKDPITLSFAANVVSDVRFENNLLDSKGVLTLTSISGPTYSSDVK
jgi:hypothetical protein